MRSAFDYSDGAAGVDDVAETKISRGMDLLQREGGY